MQLRAENGVGGSPRGRALTATYPGLPPPHRDLPTNSFCPLCSSPSLDLPAQNECISRVVNRKPCRGRGGGGKINPESAGPKPLTGQLSKVPVFKKNRTFTTQATNMPKHLCVPSTGPATKVQGPGSGQCQPTGRWTTTTMHRPRRLWEGLRGAILVGGIGPASWRSRQRTGSVQGGGGRR